jgi:hypothetical protein
MEYPGGLKPPMTMHRIVLFGLLAELKLPDVADKSVGRHAPAVWITRRGDATPVQATGGWLD